MAWEDRPGRLRRYVRSPELDLVAVNDLMAIDNRYISSDTIPCTTMTSRFPPAVPYMWAKRNKIPQRKRTPKLPWKDMGIDVVFECTGVFTSREGLEKHLHAGAQNVILSAPSKGEDDVPMVVHCVKTPEGACEIISCASCTTNCTAPVMEVLQRHIGIKKALTTIMPISPGHC
jgi:glyceraldehyde 3-phosphate dehydrogenase